MSKYVKRSMQDDERVLHQSYLHWIIYRIGVFLILIGMAMGHFLPTALMDFMGDDNGYHFIDPIRYASVGMIVLGIFQLLMAYIRQISTELVITDKRVIAKRGLIATTSYELMMTKVEGAIIEQSVMGRALGYGTLVIQGTGGGISPINHVAHPFYFHAALMETLHRTYSGDQRKNVNHD